MLQSDGSERGKRLAWRRWRLALPAVFLLLLCLMFIGPPMRQGPAHPSDLARMDMRRLGEALDLLRSDIGRYPTETEGLASLLEPPQDEEARQHWQGPYLREARLPRDPWRQPYHYSPVGRDLNAFALYSDGPPGDPPGPAIGFLPPH